MSSLLHKFSLASLKSRRPAVTNAQPSWQQWQQDPIYKPLDATQDSIRLVYIHPADDPDAPIQCTISEAKFSERPQYEALSYMWGDEAVQRPIFVNGHQLQITQNLFDALHFLRLRQRASNGSAAAGLPSLRYWIDAICINQNDVHEKNKQIPIMPHIYFRAKTVLVWLGKKQVPKHLYGMHESSEEFSLHKIIYHDEYWNRLWIIQEIGKATQLQVCYVLGLTITESSGHSLEWNQLIQDVESHYTRHASGDGGQGMTDGPIRLDRQLRGKYTGSHNLLSLIITHRDARCRDPRDKIFGLVGLATDSTRDFPIDYQKSLFEVWKDTLTHLLLANQIGPANLVDMAVLVLESLGGPTQVLLPQTPSAKAPSSSSSALGYIPVTNVKLRLTVLGIVMFVGPTPGDVINSLEQADLWTKSIQRHVTPAQKGGLLRENDGLLECLLKMGGDLDLPSLGIGPSPTGARDRQRARSCLEADGFLIGRLHGPHLYLDTNHLYAKQARDEEKALSKMKSKSKDGDLQEQPPCRLYRLKMTAGPPESSDEEGCNLGLATDVRSRDLLCRIPQTGRTFFLRAPKADLASNTLYREFCIAGTALVAQELFPPEKRVPLRKSWDLTLTIDFETLYRLLT
jgi:hypothetical protein